MITIKKANEIELLREGGKRLAAILRALADEVKPGVKASFINDRAEELIRAGGDLPVFLGYQPDLATRPYPATLCVSVNDEIVHGIPNEKEKMFKEGDIVGLDIGLSREGMIVDTALTVPVGKIDDAARKLLNVTKESLAVGIKAARGGAKVGDIGAAVEAYVKPHGYGIVRELAGHGVGYAVHEEPYVPNFGKKNTGAVLKPGMVIAIEPMLNEGTADVILEDDGYTFRTKDGKRSAHFEHTILITDGAPEILTKN